MQGHRKGFIYSSSYDYCCYFFFSFFLLLQQVGREDGAGVDYSCEGEEDFFLLSKIRICRFVPNLFIHLKIITPGI